VELRDFIVTPIIILVVVLIAYTVRKRVTDPVTMRYYYPALMLKIFGAIAVGFIYQFYYDGGDTFAYHTHGSRHIWDAFFKSPEAGVKLLFSNGSYIEGFWDISDKIWYYRDQKSFFIIRIAAVLDLITFSSYSATAVLFAVISFCGGWMFFLTFYRKFPAIHKWLAVSCLFVPSIIFWGSGILKDTVTLAFVGVATYCINDLFIEKRFSMWRFVLLLFSIYVVSSVKVYIMISFLAAAIVWVFYHHFYLIKVPMIRILVIPFVVASCGGLSYLAINKVVEDDPRYSLKRIGQTARTTAYDIRFWTGKDAGSGYTLGELDGTIGSMVRLAPSAINVTLFRPYLWEVNNPLMLLSALESFMTLMVTLYVIARTRSKLFKYIQSPEVVFCLIFALTFAFGVGVSTYNFGTLARYKIPLFPFYFTALGLVLHRFEFEKNERMGIISQ